MAHRTAHFAPVLFTNLSISGSFLRNLQKTRVCACFPFSYESYKCNPLKISPRFSTGHTQSTLSTRGVLEANEILFSWSFPPHLSSSSLTNNIFDSFHPTHSRCCAPPPSSFYTFPFSHLCLYFHSVPRPLSVWLSFNQDRHCPASWCCKSSRSGGATDKCSMAHCPS